MLNRPFPYQIKISFLCFVAFTALSVRSTHAEMLKLISGDIVVGEIVEIGNETVKIDSGIGIPVTYYFDEIELIDGEDITTVRSKQAKKEIILRNLAGIDPNEPEMEVEVLETIQIEPAEGPVGIAPITKEQNARDISVIDDKTKEATSPFGPTVKENSKIRKLQTESSGADATSYLMGRVLKEGGLEVSTGTKDKTIEDRNIITRSWKRFIGGQKKRWEGIMQMATQNLPLTREWLESLPLRVRRDILIFSSASVMIMYILVCYPMMAIARRIGRKHAWLAWVPVAQNFYLIHVARRRMIWSLLYFVPVVNLIVPMIMFASIIADLNRSAWLIVPAVIPGLNILVFWHCAFSKPKIAPIKL